jgi:hypothetical protein
MKKRRVRVDRNSAGVQVAQLRKDLGWQLGCHMLLNDLSDRLRDLRPQLHIHQIGIGVGIVEIRQVHRNSRLAAKSCV